MAPGAKKIGIWGFFGYGNLGDAAIQESIIQAIKKRLPQATIYGFSLNPIDTRQRHHIDAFPIYRKHIRSVSSAKQTKSWLEKEKAPSLYRRMRNWLKTINLVYPLLKGLRKILLGLMPIWEEIRFLVNSFWILRDLNVLVISGGGALDEYWGGPWRHPFALFKWAALAKIARVKLYVLSVGASSLKSPVTQFFVKCVLALADFRSFRDENSKRLVENIGFTGESHVFPDLAYNLEIDKSHRPFIKSNESRIVGINPIAYFDPRSWPEKDDIVYRNYVSKMSSFIYWLVQEQYRTLFFATDIFMDRLVVTDIKECLENMAATKLNGQIIDPSILTVSDLLVQISSTDLIVASRLHAILLSHVMHKPVLAISYDKKVKTLMENMGQLEYCQDIKRFEVDSLIDVFKSLESNKKILERQIVQRMVSYRDALQDQFDRTFFKA